jgi:hypothetical protein
MQTTVLCGVLAAPAALIAQEPAAPQGKAAQVATPSAPRVPVRVQLLLTRYDGDKKISSMPYTMQLIANERETTRLRMGVEVPIAAESGGFTYRSVGTNIDCRAETADGSFKLGVTINDSSIRMADEEKSGGAVLGVATKAAPAFRSFSAHFTILLRDGQTAQYTTATDPLSGEVLKVDATLTVLK